jgi:hypothetical protein
MDARVKLCGTDPAKNQAIFTNMLGMLDRNKKSSSEARRVIEHLFYAAKSAFS